MKAVTTSGYRDFGWELDLLFGCMKINCTSSAERLWMCFLCYLILDWTTSKVPFLPWVNGSDPWTLRKFMDCNFATWLRMMRLLTSLAPVSNSSGGNHFPQLSAIIWTIYGRDSFTRPCLLNGNESWEHQSQIKTSMTCLHEHACWKNVKDKSLPWIELRSGKSGSQTKREALQENRTGDYFDKSTHSTKPKEWCCYLFKETGHNHHDCLLRNEIHRRSKWSSSTLQSVFKHLQQYNQPVLMLELPTLCLFGKDGWKGGKALHFTTHVSFVMNLWQNSMTVPVFV